MSTVLEITVTGAIDGTTLVDLANPAPDPDSQAFEYTFAAAGRFPLHTLAPIGANPVWLQLLNEASAGLVTVTLELPNGTTILIPLPQNPGVVGSYNLLIPQGAILVIDDAGSNPGSIEIWAQPLSHDSWYKVQCCHLFAPDSQCCPPTVSNLFLVAGAGVLTGVFVLTGAPQTFDLPIAKLDGPDDFTARIEAVTGPFIPTLVGTTFLPGAAGFSDVLRIDIDSTGKSGGENGTIIIENECGCCASYAYSIDVA